MKPSNDSVKPENLTKQDETQTQHKNKHSKKRSKNKRHNNKSHKLRTTDQNDHSLRTTCLKRGLLDSCRPTKEYTGGWDVEVDSCLLANI